MPQILVVDDDRFDNGRYCQLLRSAGYEVQGVTSGDQALQVMARQVFDVMLLDMLLPQFQGQTSDDFGGLEVLRHVKRQDEALQVIVITGYGNRELALKATSAGAMDYITKDIDTEERLPSIMRAATKRAAHIRGLLSTQKEIHSQDGELSFATPNHLVANSEAMRQMLRRAQSLAHLDEPILIVGERGVGKHIVANSIHINSRYAAGPFLIVSYRNLSANLAELWGEVGSKTPGLCAQVENGTLVLKDIDKLSLIQQRELMQLMAEKQYRPLGASAPVHTNLRIIATTTSDMERLVRQGRFLPELFDVLSVSTLTVPPLRERRDKDDILAIAGYLLRHYGLAQSIAPAAAELLAVHDYAQSNINELEDILRGAAVQARGQTILPHHLPAALQNKSEETVSTSLSNVAETVELTVRFIAGDPPLLLWESHEGGSTQSKLHLPFSPTDLPLLLRALDAVQWPGHPIQGPHFNDDERARLTHLGLWKGDRVATDIDQRVGQQLYKALVADPVASSVIGSARNTATTKRLPLSLTLRFQPDAVSLAALPWELLWDERQALLLNRTTLPSCVRYIDVPQAVPPPPVVGRKLRLLAICPCEGMPDDVYGTEEESRTISLQALSEPGVLVSDEVRPAHISTLTDRLLDGEPIDILHFYGHGGWQGGEAYLQLDDGRLNANQLATLIGDIPLVVLYACRSGTVSVDDMFTGIAPMLSTEGVGAVVAMQFTMSIKAANRFSTVLYRNLARGESLQIAVAKARQALYIEHRSSWFVPVVYIRSRDQGPLVIVR